MEAVRTEYLFEMAYHCHIPPDSVDRMRILDFIRFTQGIDEIRKSNAEAKRELDRLKAQSGG